MGSRSHIQPVLPVISHVIATKREHGHWIVTQHADFSCGGRRFFAAQRGSQESTMSPIERLIDKRRDA